MTTALAIFVAWTLGALVVAGLAMMRSWQPVPTVLCAAGATLLVAGAIQFLPGVIEALRRVNLTAPPGPYSDTYFIVGHGHLLVQLGLFFLIGAAITVWIARKGGLRTRWLLTFSAALLYVAVGAQLAIVFGVIPELMGIAFDGPGDFARINLALALVSQASFLALGGVLVCCVLTLRRMLQR